MNNIFYIQIYKFGAAWVFDDKERGLVKEPFVSGIPEIINKIVGDATVFDCYFSNSQFPDYNFKLIWEKEEYGGNWYIFENNMRGWLCPALFKFFECAPREIYLLIRSKTNERKTNL
jgi:hypothetical protein